jgi:methanethiol S-methyltransferase
METQGSADSGVEKTMSDLTPFLANLSAILAYGIFHSLLASTTVKQWTRQLAGMSADRLYRLGFNVVAFISFLPVIWVFGMWPGGEVYAWTGAWKLVPLTLQPVLLVLFMVAAMQTQPMTFIGLRQLLGGKDAGGLRTTGIYSVVRHPLYTLGLGILWLFPVMTAGFLGLACGITVYILIGSTLEERRLVNEFGAEYIQYKKRVKKLIPYLY